MTSSAGGSWNKSYEPLMKLVLHKKGVQTRQAAEVGKKVVKIFRGKDFLDFLTKPENFALLARKCPDAIASCSSRQQVSVEDAKKLADNLISNGFIARSVAKILKVAPPPSNPQQDNTNNEESSETKVVKKTTKKWPEKVIRLPLEEQEFEAAGSFYIVLYEGSKTVQHILSVLAIAAVLVMCMFPAWPAWAKIGVWYLVFWLSTAMIVILVVRIILFVCIWTCGVDFWLFPNILDEYAGIIDSFKPLYSYELRKDGYAMTTIRLASMIVIALATYEFAQHNSWEDIRNFATNSINDILDWGIDKLTALPQPKNQYLSIADIERLTDEETKHPTTIPPETVVDTDEQQPTPEDIFDDMQEF